MTRLVSHTVALGVGLLIPYAIKWGKHKNAQRQMREISEKYARYLNAMAQ